MNSRNINSIKINLHSGGDDDNYDSVSMAVATMIVKVVVVWRWWLQDGDNVAWQQCCESDSSSMVTMWWCDCDDNDSGVVKIVEEVVAIVWQQPMVDLENLASGQKSNTPYFCRKKVV